MVDITTFCDSSWATCPFTRQSLSGYCLQIWNDMVSWKGKKQTIVSRSSAEAEYSSIGFAISEAICLRGLLEELGFKHIPSQHLFSVIVNQLCKWQIIQCFMRGLSKLKSIVTLCGHESRKKPLQQRM